MDSGLQIDVSALDASHRRALEEVIGQQLAANQRLTISVTEVQTPEADSRPAQTLADWAKVYEGLSEQEVSEVDEIINSRANLTRYVDLP